MAKLSRQRYFSILRISPPCPDTALKGRSRAAPEIWTRSLPKTVVCKPVRVMHIRASLSETILKKSGYMPTLRMTVVSTTVLALFMTAPSAAPTAAVGLPSNAPISARGQMLVTGTGDPSFPDSTTEPGTPAREAEDAALSQNENGLSGLASPNTGTVSDSESCNESFCVSVQPQAGPADPTLVPGYLGLGLGGGAGDSIDSVDGFDSMAPGGPTQTEGLGPANGAHWPDGCLDVNKDYQYRGANVVLDRRVSCLNRIIQITVREVRTGRVLGTGSVYVVTWNTLSSNSRSWLTGIQMNMYTATGVLAAGSGYVRASVDCAYITRSCSPVWTTPSQSPLTLNSPVYGTWRATQGGTQVSSANTFVLTTFGSYGATEASVWANRSFAVRCDSEPYFRTTEGSCVHPAKAPWATAFGRNSAAPKTSDHIYDAQIGQPDHWAAWYDTLHTSHPLTRLTGRFGIDRNRTEACGGFTPDPGETCDEFPFASTYQGAYYIPSLQRRSVRSIPGDDNSAGGSILSAFYARWRVIDGEAFYITVGR